MEQPQVYKREDMLPIAKVCRLIPGKNGGPCSRQHVYNLIDQGLLSPAFRYGKSRGMFVPRPVVERFLQGSVVDPGE